MESVDRDVELIRTAAMSCQGLNRGAKRDIFDMGEPDDASSDQACCQKEYVYRMAPIMLHGRTAI